MPEGRNRAAPFDRFLHAGDFVNRYVVHEHDVTSFQSGSDLNFAPGSSRGPSRNVLISCEGLAELRYLVVSVMLATLSVIFRTEGPLTAP